MWCNHCQAEVAGEATHDNQHVKCAVCGNEITTSRSLPSVVDDVPKDPKELLARWASDEILDPYGPVLGKEDHGQSGDPLPEIRRSESELDLSEISSSVEGLGMARTFPLTTSELAAAHTQRANPTATDTAHEPESPATKVAPADDIAVVDVEPPPEAATDAPSESHQQEVEQEPLDAVNSLPTADEPKIQSAPPQKRRGGAMMFFGQVLAFIGVFSLTVGGTLVVWGYFGDRPTYAPLGWLVLTAGQMFLFLGMVTLVSGGLEQTASLVEEKVDILSAEIVRIEQIAQMRSQDHRPLTADSRAFNPALLESPPEAAA